MIKKNEFTHYFKSKSGIKSDRKNYEMLFVKKANVDYDNPPNK